MLLLLADISLARPPQAAIDVCQSQQPGDSCQFDSPRHAISGTCKQPPHEPQLLCIPSHHKKGEGRRPPPRGENRNAGNGGPPDGPPPMGEHRPPHDGFHKKKPSESPNNQHVRSHEITQSNGQLSLVPADTHPVSRSKFSDTLDGEDRILRANGISKHLTGRFPNNGNPNTINDQYYTLRIDANPTANTRPSPLRGSLFGIAFNGVPFDPGTAEQYKNKPQWRYEALSGAVALGLDANHAHVQPTGAYHYHGIPQGFLSAMNVQAGNHSPQIGWAADGFPIYALYGYQTAKDASSPIAEQTSSYSLKRGKRPADNGNPGGQYDGTFTADYVYKKGKGSLDECNGRYIVSPEFPNGTYAYFLSQEWPVIPRCFRGRPSEDFRHRR